MPFSILHKIIQINTCHNRVFKTTIASNTRERTILREPANKFTYLLRHKRNQAMMIIIYLGDHAKAKEINQIPNRLRQLLQIYCFSDAIKMIMRILHEI